MAPPSDKSRGVAFALALVLGMFGAHRFYVGKVGTGILQLCTFGGLGLWYLYDVVLVAGGGFRDADGRRVTRWDLEDQEGRDLASLPQELLDELYALRTEVNELHERMDFTERLVSGPRPEGTSAPSETGPVTRR